MLTTTARFRGARAGFARAVERSFSDGTLRCVDVGPLLWGPVFSAIAEDSAAFTELFFDPRVPSAGRMGPTSHRKRCSVCQTSVTPDDPPEDRSVCSAFDSSYRTGQVRVRWRMRVNASIALSSASGSVCRYFWVVWIWECPRRSITVLRSAPPARSHEACA